MEEGLKSQKTTCKMTTAHAKRQVTFLWPHRQGMASSSLPQKPARHQSHVSCMAQQQPAGGGSLTSTQAPAKNTNALSSMKSCKSDHVSCRQLKYCSEATGGASSRRHGIHGRSATRAGRKWARGRRHCFTQNLVAAALPCIATRRTSERPAGARQAPALAAHPRQSSLSTACSVPR